MTEPENAVNVTQPVRSVVTNGYQVTTSVIPEGLGSTTRPSPGPIVEPELGSSTIPTPPPDELVG
jgi:hypothetical protein